MKFHLTWLMAVLMLLSGCSSIKSIIPGGDDEAKPAPLEEITTTVKITREWSKSVGDTKDRSRLIQPVLAGNRLFATSSAGLVTAVDIDTGETIWRRDLKLPVSAGVGYGDALVYVGTSEGEVIAMYAVNGETVWRAELEGEILASPMAGEGIAVVPTSVDRVIGLSTVDGSRKWSLRETTPRLSLRGRSRPLVRNDIAFAGFEDGKLLLIRLNNGQILWENRVGDAVGKSELERLADVDTRPVLIDNTVYAAAYQSHVVAINAPSSRIVWKNNTSTFQDMAVDDAHVYVTDDHDVVVAIDRRSGLTAWQQQVFARRGISAPAVAGDYVVVGDKESYLHVLDRQTGKQLGRIKIDGAVVSQPLVRGTTVYIQTDKGLLGAWRLESL